VKVIETKLPGVLIIEPKIFDDARGFFMETFNQEKYAEVGIKEKFVQDNLSFSSRGVLRGLHYQNPNSQGKLGSVVQGEVFDVAVDIRVGSPNFGQWVGVNLSGENHWQLWVPPGFAHGFCVLSATAYFNYKCTDYYTTSAEAGVMWNDPDVGIEWPIEDVLLSDKDKIYCRLKDISVEKLPKYKK